MKFSLSVFTDSLFSFFVAFALCFTLLNYFIPRQFSVTFSSIIAILFAIIVCKSLLKKDQNKRLKRKEEQEKANMLTQLNFLSKREVNDFFEEVILKKVSKTERKKGGIFIKDKNLAVFPFFSFTQVGKAEVVRAYNSIKATDTAYILSEKYTADVVSFANRFDGRIVLIDADKVFSYLKENDALPENKHLFPNPKKSVFSMLKELLIKKKAKTFLAFGFLFLFYSFFVPIKSYYIVFGCAFLIVALFNRLFGKEAPTKN